MLPRSPAPVHPTAFPPSISASLPASLHLRLPSRLADSPQFFFWEVVETYRKLVLVSFIVFVDIDHGSNKVLRLAIGTFITGAYAVVLATCHPMRDVPSHNFALAAQLVLLACFVCGSVIKLCEDDAYLEEDCFSLVGIASPVQATFIVVGACAATLLAGLAAVAWQVTTAARRPTLRLAKTGEEPILTLPRGCNYFSFVSHAWATGQALPRPSTTQIYAVTSTLMPTSARHRTRRT